VYFAAGAEGERRAAPVAWRTGAWFRLGVGVLPDGRCVFTMDDRVVLVSARVITMRGTSGRLMTWGNSDRTRILIGPLEAVTGIPPGVARQITGLGESRPAVPVRPVAAGR
jgi:hypothetical protein